MRTIARSGVLASGGRSRLSVAQRSFSSVSEVTDKQVIGVMGAQWGDEGKGKDRPLRVGPLLGAVKLS